MSEKNKNAPGIPAKLKPAAQRPVKVPTTPSTPAPTAAKPAAAPATDKP